MFGFIVKKEFVLNKIKEYLNYQDEIDYSNLPESFKEILNNHFSIECLNAYQPHKVLHDLRKRIFELNPELECEKNIHMVCQPNGKLYIGFVKKEDFVRSDDYHYVFDNSYLFDENITIELLEQLKEYIGIENILYDISDYTVGLYHDIENKGHKFLFELLYTL
jgi:hypothetical protein